MNFFGRTNRAHAEPLETVIGASANLRGTLQSDGGIRVEGVFEGLIETAGNVVVGPAARVVADITARNVTVAGAVKGNIDANGRLEILSSGAVYGDVQVDAVMIDEGGQFHGVSRMRGLSHPALAAPIDMPAEPVVVIIDEVDVELDEAPVEARARHVPDVAGAPRSQVGTAVYDTSGRKSTHSATGNGNDGVIDFDFEGINLDIEPVIPDSPPASPPAPTAKRRSRRRPQ